LCEDVALLKRSLRREQAGIAGAVVRLKGGAFREDSLVERRRLSIMGGQVENDGGDGIYSTNFTSIQLVPSDNSIDRL
jgi:hypothetical protein